jgi:hypothetical protein
MSDTPKKKNSKIIGIWKGQVRIPFKKDVQRFKVMNPICKFCIYHQFYYQRPICMGNESPANNSKTTLAEYVCNQLTRTGTPSGDSRTRSSTHLSKHQPSQLFRIFRHTHCSIQQSTKKLSSLNMPKNKPEMTKRNRKRSRSEQETINLSSSSSPEANPRPVKIKIARRVKLIPEVRSKPSTRNTRAKTAKRKPQPPTSSDSDSSQVAETIPRRKSTLGDVRPNSVLSDRLSRSRSPRSTRTSPQPTTSDGRRSRPRNRSTRRVLTLGSPSSPRRKSHWNTSPVSNSESASPKNTTPLGSHLNYEFSPASKSADSRAPENSLDGSISNLDEDLPRDHPLRVAINATGLHTEEPPNLRYSIRSIGTRERNWKREVRAHLSEVHFAQEPPIKAADPSRKYKVQDWIPNRLVTMKKLFMTRWQDPPSVKRIPLIEGPPPSACYFADCELAKIGFEDLPGCNKAMFYEDMDNLPILIRSLMYVRGDVLIVGARQDHGPRLLTDNRPESDRVGAVFRAIRDDFMRLTSLWDLGPPESVALAFHPQLFADGSLLTASGGIPGCPSTLTQTQRDECRKSAEDLGGIMADLQRERMRHRGENMAHDGSPGEGQIYSSNELRLAAAEFGRECNGLEPLPRFAVQLFKRAFTQTAEVPPEPQVLGSEQRLLEEMDAIIQDREVVVEPPPPLVLPPPRPKQPGMNCAEARAFLKYGKATAGVKCPDTTCAVGSPFIRGLTWEDNLRPDSPPYAKVTFRNAGARSRMGEGPNDLRKFGARTFWHYDNTTPWPPIEAKMKKVGFEHSCRSHAIVTVDTEDYIHGDLGKNHPGHRKGGATKQIKNPYRTFTAVTIGSPDGGILVIHCNYNGYSYDGPEIPQMIKDLLADPNIFILQFGVETDMDRLAAGGIITKGWVDASNLTMIAYPQPEVDKVNNMRSGCGFAAAMLDSPTRMYVVQRREKEALKARVRGVHGPPEPHLPPGCPDYRYMEEGVPMYTDYERRQRMDHFDTVQNPLDIPIDLMVDDFSQPGKWWNGRMHLFVAHHHSVPMALLWRMCFRYAELHHDSMQADALRHAHFTLLAIKELEVFSRATNPASVALRAGGTDEWMTSDGSPPIHGFKAKPFFASSGYTTDTNARAIANSVVSRPYRYAVDAMGLSQGFRVKLESLNRGKLDNLDIHKRIIARFQEDAERPHRCSNCGSGDHPAKECKVEMLRCIFPRCQEDHKEHGHVLAVCPSVIARCTNCKRLGHQEHHHTTPYMVLINDFLAAAPFHHLGIFTSEKLTATMYAKDKIFHILSTIDFSKTDYVTMFDRRLLSVLPYDLP